MTYPSRAGTFADVTELMRQGWTFADAAQVIGYRTPLKSDKANISRLASAGKHTTRTSAERMYAHLVHTYDDADEATLADLVGIVETMLNGGVTSIDLDAMISAGELELAHQLLTLGYAPQVISEASEDLSLQAVLEATQLGLTPDLIVRIHKQRRRATRMSDVVTLVKNGLPIELIEDGDIDSVTRALDLGLTYDDLLWLTRKDIAVSNVHNWWSDGGVFADDDPQVRRVLVLTTILVNEDPVELRPIAAACANQPWTETLLTLLLDNDGAPNLAEAIVTARALEGQAMGTPPVGHWEPLEYNHVEPRTVTRSTELTGDEARIRTDLRKRGIEAPWDIVRFWLRTGMNIENAVTVGHWAGDSSQEWVLPVSARTGLNPLIDEPTGAQWLAAALESGHSLDDVRLLASTYHLDGTIGVHAAARVLGLGTSLETAYTWARRRLDVDTAAICTAYGIDEPHLGRIASQSRDVREHATLMLAMGLDGSQLETALRVVNHWHRSTGSDLTTGDPAPIAIEVIELLDSYSITTSELIDHSINDWILEGSLDLPTRRLVLELHTRLGRHAGNYGLSRTLVAYAAAISGSDEAERIVATLTPPASRDSEDVGKALMRLAGKTRKVRTQTGTDTPGRAVRITSARSAGRGR